MSIQGDEKKQIGTSKSGSNKTLGSGMGLNQRSADEQNPEKTSKDGNEGGVHTTNIDQKVERNINHFYNCKFVIKSREGSKATLRDDSNSRSKERKNEEVEVAAKKLSPELSETPILPEATDEQRVQKLIEKYGSYASFKPNNQKFAELPISGDLAAKSDPKLKKLKDLENFISTPKSGRSISQIQQLAFMLSNNKRKEEVFGAGQAPITPSNTLRGSMTNQQPNRDNIFDFFQNNEQFQMNQAPSLSSQCQGVGMNDKKGQQNAGLSQQQQKSSMLLRLLGAQNQATKQANGQQALKLFTQPQSNNGRGTSRNASPLRPSEKRNGGEFFSKLQKIALSARIVKEQDPKILDKSSVNMNEPNSPDEQKISPSGQFLSLRNTLIKDHRQLITDQTPRSQACRSPRLSVSKISNREALEAILPLLNNRQISAKSKSNSRVEDQNQALGPDSPMPAFERQNMGIVSNLALANLNQDIEDLVPQPLQPESSNRPTNQIQQMQDMLNDRNLAQALMNQLNRPKAQQQIQAKMSYAEMRMKSKSQIMTIQKHLSMSRQSIDPVDKEENK